MRDGSKNDDNNKAVRKSKNATATITITTIKVKITSDLRTTFEAKLFNQPADRHTHADTHVGRQTNRPRRPVEPAARACRNSQRISEAATVAAAVSAGCSLPYGSHFAVAAAATTGFVQHFFVALSFFPHFLHIAATQKGKKNNNQSK